ncbi:Heat shock 70 kDa protein 12B [Mytilus edulis]|uniref:Heat shock 70 kDa protein 12B n=1 Tax=Mytilus edulis TaxID=6550 RepID=A0A8S3S1V9_MYTED|nr:Heat shock 70 kDa protein 12B [Mytilus edulis]
MEASRRTSECRGSRLVVAAIDLGTTFSGYAFSFKSDFESNPLKISTNDWSAEGVHSSEMKAPSILLLNPDQSFNCFGYRAQHTYSDLLDDDPDKAAKYYFVKNFKMQLHNREISLGMMILDVTGKELPAIKVFTESIRFLKDHFLEMFTDKKLGFTINDVFFVITVPAIWSDAAKQFMRVASEKIIYRFCDYRSCYLERRCKAAYEGGL